MKTPDYLFDMVFISVIYYPIRRKLKLLRNDVWNPIPKKLFFGNNKTPRFQKRQNQFSIFFSSLVFPKDLRIRYIRTLKLKVKT